MSKTTAQKLVKRKMRHNRVRARVNGTAERPRLVVFRSLKHNYAQAVDDVSGKVLFAYSDIKTKSGTKSESAKKVGLEIAKKAVLKGVKELVFDRNGYKYHGRVKALCDGLREGGIKV